MKNIFNLILFLSIFWGSTAIAQFNFNWEYDNPNNTGNNCNGNHTAGYKKLGNGKTVYVTGEKQSYYKGGALKSGVLQNSTYLKTGNDKSLYIKPGFEITFFETGSLKKAKLHYDTYLKGGNEKSYYVDANDYVRFYKSGYLKSFTPHYDAYYKTGADKSLYMKGGKELGLHKNGQLESGTLAISANIKSKNGMTLVQAGKQIELDENGFLITCH